MNDNERMLIEWQCTKLCRLFANLSDRNDFRALCDLFTPDGSLYRPSVPDVEIRGRETIYEAFLKRPPLVIRHIVSNCVIDVHSPSEASGHSYISFLAAPLEEAPLPVGAGPVQVGEFRDRFVLTDAGWRFSERRGMLALRKD